MSGLKERWKVNSNLQVFLILIAFACTGITVAFIKRPLILYLFPQEIIPLWASIAYYLLILPVYNVILLIYGFIFGQFAFFLSFERRLLKRIFFFEK